MFFFFNDTATTEIYTLSLHDALRSLDQVPDRLLARAGRLVRKRDRRDPRQAIGVLVRTGHVRHRAMCGSKRLDRKSTRLNSSHANISYAVFCLKKKNKTNTPAQPHP